MNDEAKCIVKTLRHLADKTEHSFPSKSGDTCDSCPMNTMGIISPDSVDCGYMCPGYIMEKAADMIEELTAERDELQDKLSGLLSYVTHGRFSKSSYTLPEMKHFVDDACNTCCNIAEDRDEWKRRAEAAEIDIARMLVDEECDLCIYCKEIGNDTCVAGDVSCYNLVKWRGPCKENGGADDGEGQA